MRNQCFLGTAGSFSWEYLSDENKRGKIFYTKAVGLYPAGKRENVELWIREWQITFTLYKIHSGRKVKAGTGKKPGKLEKKFYIFQWQNRWKTRDKFKTHLEFKSPQNWGINVLTGTMPYSKVIIFYYLLWIILKVTEIVQTSICPRY